jgi:predicted phage terminase large subunit-like protein
VEVSNFLNLTPEQIEERKRKWREKKKLVESGQDPDKIKSYNRALKALRLLRADFDSNQSLIEDPNERIALCGIVVNYSCSDYYFFVKYVLDMDLMTEQTHKKWADDLQEAIGFGKKRIMRLKPRGTYKTSLYGLGLMLWVWGCQSPQIRVFYTSANSLLLSEVSDKLNQYIGSAKGDTFFSYIFGIVKDDSAKNTSDVFNIKGRSGKGFSLILRTSGGSTVGIHPNIIIVDDPLDQNDRESEATRNQKERWFDSLTPLLVPFHNTRNGIELESIFYIGTRWHMRDLIYHILEEIDPKLPEGKKWDVESESVFNEDRTPRYPEFFPMEKILNVKANISDEFFACQYENNPLPEGMQTFDINRLFFIRPEQIDQKLGQVVCFFDPSLGKSHSDYPMTIWLHFHNDTVTVLDAIDTKVELNLIVHQIAYRNSQYNCRTMIYEDNGVTLIKESIMNAHSRINWKIYLDPVHHTQNKHERIVSTQPELYSGHVQFMSDYLDRYPELMNQIIFYPVYGHDDGPDCLEMGIAYFRQKHFQFVRYEECL